MTPMTDERLAEIKANNVLSDHRAKWLGECTAEITRLRAELAETQAEMKPLAAHVQRDFEQAEEIARLRTRNEKLQAELAECQQSMRRVAKHGLVSMDIVDRLVQYVVCRHDCCSWDQHGEGCNCGLNNTLSAYEAAKGKENGTK